MKHLRKLSLIVALATLPFNAMAEDERMYQRGMGYGNHMMGSGYYDFCEECGTYHRRGYNKNSKAISSKNAKEKFETFIAKHLKGYSITKMEKEEMPMGIMYWVIIKDKSGNEMELHMNPWGYIRGPFVR